MFIQVCESIHYFYIFHELVPPFSDSSLRNILQVRFTFVLLVSPPRQGKCISTEEKYKRNNATDIYGLKKPRRAISAAVSAMVISNGMN